MIIDKARLQWYMHNNTRGYKYITTQHNTTQRNATQRNTTQHNTLIKSIVLQHSDSAYALHVGLRAAALPLAINLSFNLSGQASVFWYFFFVALEADFSPLRLADEQIDKYTIAVSTTS